MSTTNQQKFQSEHPVQKFLIGRFHRRFVKALRDIAPASILEVGCGEGYLLNTIRAAFPDIHLRGVDILDEALIEGRRLFPDLDLQHGDIYRLNETDRSWDVVVASEVLEHLDDPRAALRELKRVAKRAVILSVPHEPWFRLGNLARGRHLTRLGNHPEHINLWSRHAFQHFVRQEFRRVRVGGSFPWTIVTAEC